MIVQVGDTFATHATLFVMRSGPWWLDLDLADDAALSGRVTVTLTPPDASKALALHGTVMPDRDGTFGLRRRVQIVAGAGGWGKPLLPKPYANDARVRAKRVALDAAAEAGEVLATPPTSLLDVAYAREAGPASRVLDALVGPEGWFVDYSGATHCAPRPVRDAPNGLPALEFNPRTREIELPAEDPSACFIGARLRERLDAPQVVTSFELRITPEKARFYAICGGAQSQDFTDALREFTRHVRDEKLLGTYEYVVRVMQGDRCELVATDPSVPDLPLVSEVFAPGVIARLKGGATVLIVFANGDRSKPRIIGGAGEIDALELGGGKGPVARQGDPVEVFFPPVVSGTLAGSPLVLNMAGLKSYGTIKSGSPKVKA